MYDALHMTLYKPRAGSAKLQMSQASLALQIMHDKVAPVPQPPLALSCSRSRDPIASSRLTWYGSCFSCKRTCAASKHQMSWGVLYNVMRADICLQEQWPQGRAGRAVCKALRVHLRERSNGACHIA